MLKLARSTAFTVFASLASLAFLALDPARAWAAATRKPPAAVPATKPSLAKPTAKPTEKNSARRNGKNGKKVPKNAPVVLYQINRRETMALRLRDGKGRPVKGMQRRFDHFLRCHYTNVEHKMDPRLMRLLFQTGHHWPGRRLEVVSGYRHPDVAKNPHSPHMKGLACDFRVEGVRTAELRDYLRHTFDKVGVGYYPNSTFVHLDVRKDRSAFWIDYSGPGERAVYSATPDQDLKNGRADSYHPTKIDDSWVQDSRDDPQQAPAPDGRASPSPDSEKEQETP
ncbi:MAG TPA: DUF882 domain-containing protein [Polyangia bacterium]|jgi:uncharacterized protein YcbK (DUF882 family)|nr:DUF882 domain-containing protein [Polyangia bacterium]